MDANSKDQWVHIVIKDLNGHGKVQVRNARLQWGKFTDKSGDNELSPSEINEVVANHDHNGNIYSSGRENAAAGTEGSFELVDENEKLISRIYWDCPWGSKTNHFEVSDIANRYVVEQEGAHKDGGALGTVEVKVYKRPN